MGHRNGRATDQRHTHKNGRACAAYEKPPYDAPKRKGCPDNRDSLSNKRPGSLLIGLGLLEQSVVSVVLVHDTLLVAQTEAKLLEQLNRLEVVGLELVRLLEIRHGGEVNLGHGLLVGIVSRLAVVSVLTDRKSVV